VSTFFCLLLSCVGRGLASGRSPVQGVPLTVQYIHKFQKINSEQKEAKRSNPCKTTTTVMMMMMMMTTTTTTTMMKKNLLL
jgi:hypothetical protein